MVRSHRRALVNVFELRVTMLSVLVFSSASKVRYLTTERVVVLFLHELCFFVSVDACTVSHPLCLGF